MNRPLKALFVDDNPDDRLLAMRAVQREFPDLRAAEVIDQASLDAALDQGGFDFVITDFQLRWSDGLKVLREVKRRFPLCPVIMFTGTGSEEVAVEAMKAGLDDYVIKNARHFPRLATAVLNALKQVKHKREKDEAEIRFTRLFDTVPIGLFHMRPEGWVSQANTAFAHMLGYKDASAISDRHANQFFKDAETHAAWRDAIEREGTLLRFETEFRHATGKLIWVEISASALRDGLSGTIYYEGSVVDINHRHAADQEREHLIGELRAALTKVKRLSGLLPICSCCKKIRDDHGYWNQLEVYIQEHSDASFTHSFCPDCVKRLYPEIFADMKTQ